MRISPALTAVILIMSAAAARAADEVAASRWSVNGYGTLGVVHSNEDRADYLPTLGATEGPGRSGSLSPDLDSRMGVQLSVHPTARLSAVVQVVVEQGFDEGYGVERAGRPHRDELVPGVGLPQSRLCTPLDTSSDRGVSDDSDEPQ
jgi:hypothetical protein